MKSAEGCPANTQVGVAHAEIFLVFPGGNNIPVGPIPIEGKIFNLQGKIDGGGEPANLGARIGLDIPEWVSALGIVDGKPISSVAKWVVRSPGDYGLRNELRGLPQEQELTLFGNKIKAKVLLKEFGYTFWGGDGPQHQFKDAFVTMPTICAPSDIKAKARGYDDGVTWGDEAKITFTPTGCDKIQFKATQTITPSTMTAGQPTPVSFSLNVDQGGFGLAQAHVKRAVVPLPEGIALSAGVGSGPGGLEDCTDEQFGYLEHRKPSCPEASKIGTVSFVSPLVGELKGDVYVGRSTPDALLREFIYVVDGDTQIKLIGKSVPDQKTGQVTTTFDDLPQQPFTSFTLNFRGGDNAVLKAPDTCGESVAYGRLEPFTGQAPISLKASVTTVGCTAKPFAPTLAASVDTSTAGANIALQTVIERTDNDQLLNGTSIAMPSGLLGRLNGVPQCALASAQAGSCPLESRIGTVKVAAGTGNGLDD